MSIVTIKKAISCWAEVSWACDPNILEAEAVRGRLALAREQNLTSPKQNQFPKPLLYLPSASHVANQPLTRKGRYHLP